MEDPKMFQIGFKSDRYKLRVYIVQRAIFSVTHKYYGFKSLEIWAGQPSFKIHIGSTVFSLSCLTQRTSRRSSICDTIFIKPARK